MVDGCSGRYWSSGGNRIPTFAGVRETRLAEWNIFPVFEQGRWLGQVVRSYLAYHAVPTNSQAITSFVHYVTWHSKRALGRRSQKGHMTWARMAPISARWEPSALAAHARICPGGAG
jgi:hypothetical protein